MRFLIPGGHFLIREHDCNSLECAIQLDILHGLYALVWKKTRASPNHYQEYYSAFRGRHQWKEMIEQRGFQWRLGTEPKGHQRQTTYVEVSVGT